LITYSNKGEFFVDKDFKEKQEIAEQIDNLLQALEEIHLTKDALDELEEEVLGRIVKLRERMMELGGDNL
jgi:hypothetical protein